jgi:hypothetical protein
MMAYVGSAADPLELRCFFYVLFSRSVCLHSVLLTVPQVVGITNLRQTANLDHQAVGGVSEG